MIENEELNEFMHIKHNNSDRDKMNFNDSAGAVILERAAFQKDQKIDYCADISVTIGEMTVICQYYKALKYSCESTGLCCASGKVKLSQLVPPPDLLQSLVSGMGSDSKHLLANMATCKNRH